MFSVCGVLMREIMTGDIQSKSEHAGKMFSPRKILILFFFSPSLVVEIRLFKAISEALVVNQSYLDTRFGVLSPAPK